jgi:prepilin-type processing-associated H-X9-DG protein
VCPSSKDTASTGATTQAIVVDLKASGHLSYIYIGKGLSDKTVTSDTVVLYEPLADHGEMGMNVLFGDGHVGLLDGKLAAKVIAAVSAGQRVKVNAVTGTVVNLPTAATQTQSR